MPLLAKNDGALAKEIRFSTRPDSGWDARLFVDDGKNRRGRSDTTFSDRRMSAWDGMLKTDKGDSVPVTVGLHDGGDDESKRGTVFSLRPPGDWDASLAPDDGEASAAPAGKAGADLKDRGLLFSVREPAEWDAALSNLKLIGGDKTPTQELRQDPIGQAH